MDQSKILFCFIWSLSPGGFSFFLSFQRRDSFLFRLLITSPRTSCISNGGGSLPFWELIQLVTPRLSKFYRDDCCIFLNSNRAWGFVWVMKWLKWPNNSYIWLQKKLPHLGLCYHDHGSELNMEIQTSYFTTKLLMALSSWGGLITSLCFLNLCNSTWIALKIRHFRYLFSSFLGLL